MKFCFFLRPHCSVSQFGSGLISICSACSHEAQDACDGRNPFQDDQPCSPLQLLKSQLLKREVKYIQQCIKSRSEATSRLCLFIKVRNSTSVSRLSRKHYQIAFNQTDDQQYIQTQLFVSFNLIDSSRPIKFVQNRLLTPNPMQGKKQPLQIFICISLRELAINQFCQGLFKNSLRISRYCSFTYIIKVNSQQVIQGQIQEAERLYRNLMSTQLDPIIKSNFKTFFSRFIKGKQNRQQNCKTQINRCQSMHFQKLLIKEKQREIRPSFHKTFSLGNKIDKGKNILSVVQNNRQKYLQLNKTLNEFKPKGQVSKLKKTWLNKAKKSFKILEFDKNCKSITEQLKTLTNPSIKTLIEEHQQKIKQTYKFQTIQSPSADPRTPIADNKIQFASPTKLNPQNRNHNIQTTPQIQKKQLQSTLPKKIQSTQLIGNVSRQKIRSIKSKIDISNARSYSDAAWQFLNLGYIQQSIDLFYSALSLDDKDPQIIKRACFAFFFSKNYRCYNDIIALLQQTNDPDLIFIKAKTYLQLDKINQANQIINKSNISQSNLLKAELYFKQQKFKQAFQLAKSIPIQRSSFLIAKIINTPQNSQLANKLLSAVQFRHCENRQFYEQKLKSLMSLKDMQQVEQVLEKMVQKFPNDNCIFNNYITAILINGKVNKAQRSILKRIQEKPNDLQSFKLLINIYEKQQKFEQLENLLFIMEQRFQWRLIKKQRADYQFLQNNFSKAQILYKQCITKSKREQDHINFKLASIYYSRQKFQDALNLFLKLENSQYVEQDILKFNIANTLVNGKMFKQALQFYSQIKDFSKLPEGLFNMAICLQKLGRHGQSINCFKRALQIRPNQKWRDMMNKLEYLEVSDTIK